MVPISESAIKEALSTSQKYSILRDQISEDISSHKYSFSDFVDVLRFALISEKVEDRVNGTRLLSDVLAQLPSGFLDSTALQFISTFYADRIKDHHNVMPAVIAGIHALVCMDNLLGDSLIEILKSFFQHTTCQSQTRGDRFKMFTILKAAIDNFEKDILAMSSDFIVGLINCIDGERDPRNLSFIFSFMPNAMKKLVLQHSSEDMFEIFACYFPIDFNPTKADSNAITRDELAERLSDCLVASNDFAEGTITLALEKLTSDLTQAKLDSLELLYKCSLNFPPEMWETHFKTVWPVLKNEIFPGAENKQILSAGLRVLQGILEQCCNKQDISHNLQTHVLGLILPHLTDVNQRLFDPSQLIGLVCVSGDPDFASDKILRCFLLQLELIDDEKILTDEQHVKIYEIICKVIRIVAERRTIEKIDINILWRIQQNALHCLRCDADSEKAKLTEMDKAIKCSALKVLNECVTVINEPDRAILYRRLYQLITNDIMDVDLSGITIELGALYPVELQSNLVDQCIDNFEHFSNFVQKKVYRNFLPLVVQMAFSQRILDLILTNIFLSSYKNLNKATFLLALESLNDLISTNDKMFVQDLQNNNCLIKKLLDLPFNEFDCNTQILNEVAKALCNIIEKLPVSEQYMVVNEHLPMLNLQNTNDLFLTKGLIEHLDKDIHLDDHFASLLNNLVHISLENENDEIRKVAQHLICNLVNRVPANTANNTVIEKVIEQLRTEIINLNPLAVELLAWLAKGLLPCGNEKFNDIIDWLIELLRHPTLKIAAVQAFEIISEDSPHVHLMVKKYLYKQKFFNMVLPKLGVKFESYGEHHLSAFMFVLKNTPYPILKLNIEKVGPSLVECLGSNNMSAMQQSLEICEKFVKESDEYFRSNLRHIISSCLRLSRFVESMLVRKTALDLLYDITNYPTYNLIPEKGNVIFELIPALDDSKRLVRTAAVRARNAWFLVGTTSES